MTVNTLVRRLAQITFFSLLLVPCLAAIPATPRGTGDQMLNCPKGPFAFGSINVRTVVVSQVIPTRNVIVGINPNTNARESVRACGGAAVSGRGGIADIEPGDAVTAKEVRDSTGQTVAVGLMVNIFVAIARLGSRTGDSVALSVLDDHTLKPESILYPRYLGVLPNRGIVSAETSTQSGLLDRREQLTGKLAKIYGYKPPLSKTVTIFRIELLQHAGS